MELPALARDLLAAAGRANERRLLVLAGDREDGYRAIERVLEESAVALGETVLVGPEDRLQCRQVDPDRTDTLLGTTWTALAFDAHDRLEPNAVGSLVGAVDGGGLFVMLAPSLEDWPDRTDDFDRRLAVEPYDVGDVTRHFRTRFVETLRAHRGIAIADLDEGTVEFDEGIVDFAAEATVAVPDATDDVADAASEGEGGGEGHGVDVAGSNSVRHDETRGARERQRARAGDHRFPAAAEKACLTGDQARAVRELETLCNGPRAVVLEAHRGRGKSSAAGIAAGCLASAGRRVLVTAPDRANVEPLFERAGEVCEALEPDDIESIDGDAVSRVGRDPTGAGGPHERRSPGPVGPDSSAEITTESGGSIRYVAPAALPSEIDPETVLIVDETAALPVARLRETLAADRVAYATTIHGYEGAGMGFSVRFRDHLAAARHETTTVTLSEPIRYAAGDPIETWSFRALLLDARPAADGIVADVSVDDVTYRSLAPPALVADEALLRETVGLLVLAHYRTEPNDVARLLDGPNLHARALLADGHVVGVALLAEEGGLPAETCDHIARGGRIRGHMIPEVLVGQLRDRTAGASRGLRVVRIATHPAVRSRGLGSRLLAEVHAEFADLVEWFGTGFGATPELLRFWGHNGYGTIHCSTTRNERSGEHSAIMLRGANEAGAALRDRHAAWFARRLRSVSADALGDLDPDVLRAMCRTVPAIPELQLTAQEWRVVAASAYGHGLFDVDPGPFRQLVVRYLVDATEASDRPTDTGDGEVSGMDGRLSTRQERLLVRRVLQGRPWREVTDELGYESTRLCMRDLGAALQPLVARYGGEVAESVRAELE